MLSRIKIAELAVQPRNSLNLLRRLIALRYSRPTVSPQPCFDDSGVQFYLDLLSKVHLILEYGAGGTTLCAATNGVEVISVDTDWRYVTEVNRQLEAFSSSKSQVLMADIGLTTDWGMPVDTVPTPTNATKWINYVSAPWLSDQLADRWPDLVLIDGRFRVACASMAAIRCMKSGRNLIVLIDDFFDRPQYWAVLRLFDAEEVGGRMAKLTLRPDASLVDAEALLNVFVRDFR